MIPFVCDDPDRIAARIFRALQSDCPCCTFWRGVVMGFGAAALLGVAVVMIAVFR